MNWLFALETEKDLIAVGRLMNVFRRKSAKPLSLAMASEPDGYSVTFVVDLPESEVEHHFNFLRRTEGVKRIAYYRLCPEGPASLLLIDTDAHELPHWSSRFPGSRLVFASHGKALLEMPSNHATGAGLEGILPFALVRTASSTAEL